MSRVFTDAGLVTWEAFATGGKYGLPVRPKVVFRCLTEQNRPARYVIVPGDEADAEEAVHGMTDEKLRALLLGARELE